MTSYTVWKSHTCFVCSGGTGNYIVHARKAGYSPTSPCDTVEREVTAHSRKEAIRLFRLGHGIKGGH